MAKKKRVTRKQLLKEPDEFLTFSAKAIRFVASNQRLVFGALIGVVVIALAFAGLRYVSNLSEQRAYSMFEEGRTEYLAAILGREGSVPPDKTSSPLEEVIRKYPKTSAAQLSLIVYANLSYHREDYQMAIRLYQRALKRFSGDGAIQNLILNGLAYAFEGEKDYRSAAEYYQKITDAEHEFMKGDAYYNYARMMEAMNRQEKAIETYQKVLQAYPDSVGFEIAKEKVLRHQVASVSPE